jgi:hypothetical protein
MSDIDPVAFGKLQERVDYLVNGMETLQKQVTELTSLAERSKGALWIGMTLASLIGAILSWIGSHWKQL